MMKVLSAVRETTRTTPWIDEEFLLIGSHKLVYDFDDQMNMIVRYPGGSFAAATAAHEDARRCGNRVSMPAVVRRDPVPYSEKRLFA